MIGARSRSLVTRLILDAGNTLWSGQRNDLNGWSEGRIMVEAMNIMGYDAMALGPQDLNLGLDALRQRLTEAKFAVLSANLTVGGEPLVEPYAIIERSGARIGVLGLTGSLKEPIEGVEVRDPVETARQLLPELRGGSDLVVVLSNLGPTAEKDLAQRLPDIDLIVGGGSAVPQSQVVWEGSVALVRAGGLGEYLGVTEVQFTEGDPSISSESLALGPDTVDDLEMVALKSRYQQEYFAAATAAPR